MYMKKFLIAFSALAVAFLMAAPAQAQQPTREQLEAMIAQMPQLPNDPAIKIGKLDNGLTYYIRKNALPEHRAEFYLATNVGAIQEEYPSQDGLAHFLEHMCFNGTKNFPDKAILDYLRSIGAEFGRNINASTGFEETQYMLNNIPVERESVVDSCLMILRDYSHFVVNDPVEIDKERGVIIEERRQRRNAMWRTMERSLPYYFKGSKMAECTLIGLQEHLETFAPESLHSFYETWYHPGNQAVVVVGDVDVDRTEAKIKEYFGIIPAKENPKPKAHLTVPANDEPIVGILTDPETTNPSVELIWKDEAAPEIIHRTVAGQVNDIVKMLVRNIMDERFNDITSEPDSPYLSGSFSIGDLVYEDIEAVMGEVALREDNILGGFEAYYSELERMKRFGFSDAEFDRAKSNILNWLENRVKKADTRRNPEFVRPILNNFFDYEPIMEPQFEYDLAQQIFTQVGTPILNQMASTLLGDKNLVIIYSGPEKAGITTPSESDLLGVIAKVKAADIKPMEGEEIASEFLDAAALKGGKVDKTTPTLYGATEWTLSHGVQVTVLPTDYTKDQIVFDLSKDGGKSLIATADLASFDDSVFGLWMNNAGISQFSGTQVSKMLTGKTLSVTPYIDNLENGVSGSTSVKDLETTLQLIYLYFTDPRFDAKEFDNGIAQIKAVLPNLVNQPNYKLQSQLYSTLYGNNPRRQMISEQTLWKASLDILERNYRALFADAAGAKMVIVGDVNLETLKPLVEKYIGALPKGKAPLKWIDTNEDIVKGRVEKVFSVDMQTPKSTVLQVWSAPIAYTEEAQAALEAVSYILDIRYVNSLREEEGGTYGASTNANISRRPKQEALIQVYFDCRPSVCDRLRELAIEGIRDLAANGPTDDEVNSAILNLKKNIPENRVSNMYWRNALDQHYKYGNDRDAEREAAINALSKETIQKTLQAVLAADNFVELVMKPAATAEAE